MVNGGGLCAPGMKLTLQCNILVLGDIIVRFYGRWASGTFRNMGIWLLFRMHREGLSSLGGWEGVIWKESGSQGVHRSSGVYGEGHD